MPAGIQYTRPDVESKQPIWYLIRDAIEGEPAIKGEYGTRQAMYRGQGYTRSQARKYLPQPNATDKSAENTERYKQYVQRAVYYNFSRRTRDGLVGQIFLRPPVSVKPSELNVMDNNADGQGLEMIQVAKRLCQSVLTYGQAGLLADYPVTDGNNTPDAIAKLGIQPTMRSYYPWEVTNWATKVIGAKRMLSLVVLQETAVQEVDDYAVTETMQYRALRLINGVYTVEIHSDDNAGATRKNGAKTFKKTSTTTPKDHKGQSFDFIPFTFVGAEANDVEIDDAPMYDLCSLNIAHYRNSADYEESAFICGQPTPVLTGLTEYWVKNVLGGKIPLGSRASISLPEGATATLLQAEPNTQPLEAMKQKEEQALALGAKLVQNHKTTKTATEVMVDTTAESSTLHNVANNVSSAMEQALRWCCMFVGVEVAESSDPAATDNNQPGEAKIVLKYRLNTEFELTRMNANDRLALIKVWQSGAITFDEMRDVLKVDGVATEDNDEALQKIQEEQAVLVQTLGAIADPLQAVDPNAPENTPPPGPGQQPQPAPKTKPGPVLVPTKPNLGAKRKAEKEAAKNKAK